jgi:hypothetical protein
MDVLLVLFADFRCVRAGARARGKGAFPSTVRQGAFFARAEHRGGRCG